jgi:hypothetical protein
MLWAVGWPVCIDACFRWYVIPTPALWILANAAKTIVFLDVIHPNARASRGCSFSMALPDTPPSSPGHPSTPLGDVAQCPFASRMQNIDTAYNPHTQPARAHMDTGLDTPPLTPTEGETKTFLPTDLKIPAHGQEPLDTSFIGVRYALCSHCYPTLISFHSAHAQVHARRSPTLP